MKNELLTVECKSDTEIPQKSLTKPIGGKIKEIMADAIEIACEICQKTFTQKNNLKRHYVEVHPGMELPDNIKDMKDPKKTCPTCTKEISYSHFKRHLNTHITSAEPRSRKSVQGNDVEDDMDMNLFKKNLPIEPMLYEYHSGKNFPQNYSRQTIGNYIFALKTFVDSYKRSEELTPMTLKECFESRFGEYFDTLKKVSQRSQILFGLQAAFQMFEATEIYPEKPEIPEFRHPKQIVKAYFRSTHRLEVFQKLDRSANEFAQAEGPMVIRNFLITETVLATKSFDFVKQLTREMFLKATEVLDANDKTQWVIEIGHIKSFQIPDFLKATLEKYLVLVSKLGVPKTNIKQDGKNDFWHALNGNNIKLFAVFEKGRLIGVQDNSSVFEDLHMGGQSHITFRMKDLTGSKIEYLGYPDGYYE